MTRKTTVSLQTTIKAQHKVNVDRRMLSAVIFGLVPALLLVLKHYV